MSEISENDFARDVERTVAHLREHLKSWAAYMAARYDASVYLVGSTLYRPNARDVDVRIVVEDNQFAARYGIAQQQIELDERHPLRVRNPSLVGANVVRWEEDGPSQAWIDDVAKFNAHLSQRLKRNMDVQIWPASHWRLPYPAPLLLAAPSPQLWIYNRYNPDPNPNV